MDQKTTSSRNSLDSLERQFVRLVRAHTTHRSNYLAVMLMVAEILTDVDSKLKRQSRYIDALLLAVIGLLAYLIFM